MKNHSKNTVAVLALSLLSLAAGPAFASDYQLSLTRKDSNIYKVDGQDVIVQTQYCYEYAYSEDSILSSTGSGLAGEVVFLSNKNKCPVKAVFGASQQHAGSYRVTISRDDDNWYEVFGTSTFIKTTMCLSLALGTDAVLVLRPGGFGELKIKGDTNCMVEGVYSKMSI